MARKSMSEPGAMNDWQKEKREKKRISVIIRAPAQFWYRMCVSGSVSLQAK
jgi:hypothetical protein